jgi:hypothetical protein
MATSWQRIGLHHTVWIAYAVPASTRPQETNVAKDKKGKKGKKSGKKGK